MAHLVQKTLEEGRLNHFSGENRPNVCTAWVRKSGRKWVGVLELRNDPRVTSSYLLIVLEML